MKPALGDLYLHLKRAIILTQLIIISKKELIKKVLKSKNSNKKSVKYTFAIISLILGSFIVARKSSFMAISLVNSPNSRRWTRVRILN